ncbi:MAG: AhpC/TSA family protein [Bacteroides sp.]|nr:AhpC/TSA family protein [Bacteroidales bacterium]MBD5283555.1 AhpC/TSA family protein [Bacteroides sp.]MBD5337343.1 AhpC/TSA family protein [Bacteroides sp.]
MKLQFLAAGALLLAVCSCNAKNEIKLSFAPGLDHPDTLYIEHNLIENQLNAKSADDLKTVIDTVVAKDGVYTFPVDQAGPSAYWARVSNKAEASSIFNFYAKPGENITINIKQLNPTAFTATGSELMEGIAKLTDRINPVNEEYWKLMQTDDVTMDKIMALTAKFVDVCKNFVKENPNSPAAVYALNQIADDDSFGDLYAELTPEAKKSILFPVTQQYFEQFQKQLEAQKKVQGLQDGKTPAPAFTLPNLQGKQVSLADFKGKWVILDFWGSWCPWCIKGFPALKDAYAKYHSKGLEVIGVDCGDTDSDWREAVAKYDLPWVQVFNGDDRAVIEKYAVQGYPTKVIINPEGVIVNVTTGEDPKFFDILADYLK